MQIMRSHLEPGTRNLSGVTWSELFQNYYMAMVVSSAIYLIGNQARLIRDNGGVITFEILICADKYLGSILIHFSFCQSPHANHLFAPPTAYLPPSFGLRADNICVIGAAQKYPLSMDYEWTTLEFNIYLCNELLYASLKVSFMKQF